MPCGQWAWPGQRLDVTGVSDLALAGGAANAENTAKMVPHAKQWGTIYNPAEVNSVTRTAMRAALPSNWGWSWSRYT